MKKLLVILMIALMLAGCSSNTDSDQRTLIISTWGLSEDVLMEDVYGPFEEAFNVKIVLDTGTTAERYAKLANDPNSNIDLIDLSQKAAADGYEAGLFEKLDYSKIPNTNDLIPSAKSMLDSGFGPAYTINSIGIIYNTETVDFEIKEWSDLWNPSLQGRISIPDIATTFGPALVVMASDVKGVDIKTDNGTAAFEALAELKPNVLKTYSRSSDLALMFANGEIDVAIVGDFGVPGVKNALETVNYVVPQSGTYANFNTTDIPVNAQNKDLAYEFINFRLSVQQQIQNASPDTLNEAPVNALAILDDAAALNKTYGEIAQRAKALDYSFINPLMADWIDQFNRIMNQ